jgi:hypothetical protein
MVKKSQSNAISTPIECQINATQIVDSSSRKEHWVSSKLCRDIYLLDKKNLPWSKSSDKLALLSRFPYLSRLTTVTEGETIRKKSNSTKTEFSLNISCKKTRKNIHLAND